MKIFLTALSLLASVSSHAISFLKAEKIQVVQLPDGTVRLSVLVSDTYKFSPNIDSIRVSQDTVQVHICINTSPLPASDTLTFAEEFSPGAGSLYQVRIFLQKSRPTDCSLSDTAAKVYAFPLRLPLTDTVDVLAVPEDEAPKPLTLYPNPTTDAVVFPLELRAGFYTVLNSLGQPVRRGSPSAGSLSLAGLPAGLYIIRFHDRDGAPLGNARIVKD